MNEEIKKIIEEFQKLLDENNLELNDDGDLVDKDTKRLVMEKKYE